MTSDNIQPLSNLKPMTEESSGEDLAPARKDYLEGRKLYSQGDYTEAAQAFHNALRGFEEQGDEQGVANAADRLGDACLARDEFAMAIANYRRAFAVCEKEDDIFSQISLNRKMAAAYRKLGDHEKAIELLFNMLEHYQFTNNPQGAVDILTIIAETYAEQGERERAADAYRSVASIHTRFKHARQAAGFNKLAESLEQEA
ncbi:MAG: tetratricopeptide repeat protein [Desulfobulbus sp.]|jgi:tetratricopeptide (TPR) repeat protein|nr:tetratricopeptide repeat protein [Desulfobulbus sp.]